MEVSDERLSCTYSSLGIFRKELAHMLHSRRKAEIEVLASACPSSSIYSSYSGLPLFSYLVDKISAAIDECCRPV